MINRKFCCSPPQPGRHSNRGLTELGAYAVNRLGRQRSYELFPWNAVPDRPKPERKRRSPGRDPLKLARYYQSLLDSGKLESRAALARFLGVSRARVTQVLNRLKEPGNGQAESA